MPSLQQWRTHNPPLAEPHYAGNSVNERYPGLENHFFLPAAASKPVPEDRSPGKYNSEFGDGYPLHNPRIPFSYQPTETSQNFLPIESHLNRKCYQLSNPGISPACQPDSTTFLNPPSDELYLPWNAYQQPNPRLPILHKSDPFLCQTDPGTVQDSLLNGSHLTIESCQLPNFGVPAAYQPHLYRNAYQQPNPAPPLFYQSNTGTAQSYLYGEEHSWLGKQFLYQSTVSESGTEDSSFEEYTSESGDGHLPLNPRIPFSYQYDPGTPQNLPPNESQLSRKTYRQPNPGTSAAYYSDSGTVENSPSNELRLYKKAYQPPNLRIPVLRQSNIGTVQNYPSGEAGYSWLENQKYTITASEPDAEVGRFKKHSSESGDSYVPLTSGI